VLSKAAEDVQSEIRLSSYKKRFEGDGPYPFEEFFLLLYLLADAEKDLSNQDREIVDYVLAKIPRSHEEAFEQQLQERGIELILWHFRKAARTHDWEIGPEPRPPVSFRDQYGPIRAHTVTEKCSVRHDYRSAGWS
jgi:hypothetical protein